MIDWIKDHKIAFVAICAIVLAGAAVTVVLVKGNTADSAESKDKSSSAAANASSTSVESSSTAASYSWLDSVENGESMKNLSNAETAALEISVAEWLSNNGYPTDSKMTYIKDDPDEPRGYALYFRVDDDGKYILAVLTGDDTWGVMELMGRVDGVNYSKEEEQKKEEEQAAAQAVPLDVLESSDQDLHTELHSSNTELDDNKLWPIGHKKAAEIIPASIIEELQADLNDYMTKHGVSINDSMNILVYEDDVVRDTSYCEFYLLAYSGNDRIVIKAEYNTVDKSHAFTLMP